MPVFFSDTNFLLKRKHSNQYFVMNAELYLIISDSELKMLNIHEVVST